MEATPQEIDNAVKMAAAAFTTYKKVPPQKRADFLRAIAEGLVALGDELPNTASSESGLPLARLQGERDRTTGQLRLFADLISEGSWVNARIDKATPDVRQMQIPLGVIGIFGASNFPLAFSVAGGDTAAALAAGCTVVFKGHPAHPQTSHLVANVIIAAANNTGMPEGVFSLLQGASIDTGQQLAVHPQLSAIAFTGSFRGGKALYDTATRRAVPIPVYAEMGSVNPVFFLPRVLKEKGEALAAQFLQSLTMGVGQFCTNPGVFLTLNGTDKSVPFNGPSSSNEEDANQPVAVSSNEEDANNSAPVSSNEEDANKPVTVSSNEEDANKPATVSSNEEDTPVSVSSKETPPSSNRSGTDLFLPALQKGIAAMPTGRMLTPGILEAYNSGITSLRQAGAQLLGAAPATAHQASPSLLQISAQQAMEDPALCHEVFGPSSLHISANSKEELFQLAQALEGQLTATIHGTEEDLREYAELVNILREKAGRIVINGFPTGVAVNHAMVHGGPWPATTPAAGTSVGSSAIYRFCRPVCYQDFPAYLLPPELQDENPLGIWRLFSGNFSKT